MTSSPAAAIACSPHCATAMPEPPTNAVWVTRPAPANARTAQALGEAGFAAASVPILEITPIADPRLPSAAAPDWVVLVSANAAHGLAAAMSTRGLVLATPQVAVVGAATAAAARALGFTITIQPDREQATGLVAALVGQPLNGRQVWIPAGNRPGSARDQLPVALEERGAIVSVFPVYETHARTLTRDERDRLAAASPWAILLHSPSAVEAVWADPTPEARAWRERATAVVVGPVTRHRLQTLGATRLVEADAPSDDALVAALQRLAPTYHGA